MSNIKVQLHNSSGDNLYPVTNAVINLPSDMETASSTNVGNIVTYMGPSNGTYISGHTYKCIHISIDRSDVWVWDDITAPGATKLAEGTVSKTGILKVGRFIGSYEAAAGGLVLTYSGTELGALLSWKVKAEDINGIWALESGSGTSRVWTRTVTKYNYAASGAAQGTATLYLYYYNNTWCVGISTSGTGFILVGNTSSLASPTAETNWTYKTPRSGMDTSSNSAVFTTAATILLTRYNGLYTIVDSSTTGTARVFRNGVGGIIQYVSADSIWAIYAADGITRIGYASSDTDPLTAIWSPVSNSQYIVVTQFSAVDVNTYNTAGKWYIEDEQVDNAPASLGPALLEVFVPDEGKALQLDATGRTVIQRYTCNGKCYMRSGIYGSLGTWTCLTDGLMTTDANCISITNGNANTITTSGFYYLTGTSTINTPYNLQGYLEHHTYSSTAQIQKFTDASSGRSWLRVYNSSTWSGWYIELSTAGLYPVTLSGTTPTIASTVPGTIYTGVSLTRLTVSAITESSVDTVIQFTTGSSFTATFPSSLKWIQNGVTSFDPSSGYIISFTNGVACAGKVG